MATYCNINTLFVAWSRVCDVIKHVEIVTWMISKIPTYSILSFKPMNTNAIILLVYSTFVEVSALQKYCKPEEK